MQSEWPSTQKRSFFGGPDNEDQVIVVCGHLEGPFFLGNTLSHVQPKAPKVFGSFHVLFHSLIVTGQPQSRTFWSREAVACKARCADLKGS